MAWAWHDFEQLWQAVHEVDDLGDEEHEQRLREMAQDACYRQRHACKVGECVPHKHLAREEKSSREAVRTQPFGAGALEGHAQLAWEV